MSNCFAFLKLALIRHHQKSVVNWVENVYLQVKYSTNHALNVRKFESLCCELSIYTYVVTVPPMSGRFYPPRFLSTYLKYTIGGGGGTPILTGAGIRIS